MRCSMGCVSGRRASLALRRFVLRRALLGLLLVSNGVTPVSRIYGEEHADQFAVIGYLPSYRIATFDFDQASKVTDVVLFSIEPRPDGSLNETRLPESSVQSTVKKLQERGCRVHVTVGGWGHSSAFPHITADIQLRRLLARNLADYCERNGLDGVDIDWEHPRNEAERQQLGQFLTDLSAALKSHHRTVSIAIAPWEILAPETVAAVDRIHLMAYDNGGRHSTLKYARDSVDQLKGRDVPEEKLCLGIPFYGRPFEGKFGAATKYSEIVQKEKPKPSVDESGGVYFNGPDTVSAKVRFAREHGLAGVMIWELGQDCRDPDRSLLNAIDGVRHERQ